MRFRIDRSRAARWTMLVVLTLGLGACNEILPQRTPGEKVYRKHCSECHGVDGAGQTIRSMGDSYANLLDDSWRHGWGGSGMQSVLSEDLVFDHPTFSKRLSREEIKQVVRHVMVLRSNQ